MNEMENLTYAEALAELQAIVNALESGEAEIDELAAKTERAAALIRYCREKLRQTDEQISRLLNDD